MNSSLLCSFRLPLLFLSCVINAFANDGSYFASGNQIIPLQETDISVKKEILTIKRIEGNKVRIVVDYTFHNPTKEKSLLMGFEADSPIGDVDGSPRKLEHPFIENFTVTFNDKVIPHAVSIFPSPQADPAKPGNLHTLEELKKHQKIPKIDDRYSPDLHYIYHFPATFPPGNTQVVHTYDYAIARAVFTLTSIDYLLTPALRWANKQIDDFTLIIDLGELQQFHIAPTFFNNLDSWETQGRVRIAMENVTNEMSGETSKMLTVWQHHGSVTFHAKNFQPKGELSLFANRFVTTDETLDAKTIKLSLQSLPWLHDDLKLKDEFTRKVLENFPYARRGHIFQNQQLKTFFEAQPWYQPNPDSKDTSINAEEKEWLKNLRALNIQN